MSEQALYDRLQATGAATRAHTLRLLGGASRVEPARFPMEDEGLALDIGILALAGRSFLTTSPTVRLGVGACVKRWAEKNGNIAEIRADRSSNMRRLVATFIAYGANAAAVRISVPEDPTATILSGTTVGFGYLKTLPGSSSDVPPTFFSIGERPLDTLRTQEALRAYTDLIASGNPALQRAQSVTAL
ncbi:MAG TPA: hypothetical protein VLE73_04650 [Candidatus Saccharimonadales bacterium]|nr:hypothetical protein [Candidatus Saccharimonadales bacterium]